MEEIKKEDPGHCQVQEDESVRTDLEAAAEDVPSCGHGADDAAEAEWARGMCGVEALRKLSPDDDGSADAERLSRVSIDCSEARELCRMAYLAGRNEAVEEKIIGDIRVAECVPETGRPLTCRDSVWNRAGNPLVY